MSQGTFRKGSLVLYKNRPARVTRVGTKLELELEGDQTQSVRPKDITLLHPGPLEHLGALEPREGDVETAWEILAGSTVPLADLAELIYGAFTPSTAWVAWELVADGLYFHGTPEAVTARSPEAVNQEREARRAKAARRRARAAFLKRVRAGRIAPRDSRYLKAVEALALGQREKSRLLRELGRAERPENAHALLLELGYWDPTVNPHPQRLNLPLSPPDVELPELIQGARLDLTHLPALAIDDEGTPDPDDAISLDGERLWVHVADAAALVSPAGDADREARARGTNLYLPDRTVPMLPPPATQRLGLGLQERSPALSFGVDLSPRGEILEVEIVPSWVRVTRLTYAEAEARLQEAPLQGLYRLAKIHEAHRRAQGAIALELPEVKIRVLDGRVVIRPLLPLGSRTLVTEAMLMAGEAAARFALARDIPFPFSHQPQPETSDRPADLAGMYALRRMLRPSQTTSHPAPHAGLGLEAYARATSPLRRYQDLVTHQQLRAFLHGDRLLDASEVLERIVEAETARGSVRYAERLSRQHWTLVYLQQHPDWQGEGILVETRGSHGTVLIPALDLEPTVYLRRMLPLNSRLTLALRDVNLPELEAHFQVVE